jgi:hypothetical protein
MKKVRKLYLSFWHPGTMVAEQSTSEVDSIVGFDPHKVEWPKNAYAFRLFERFDVVDGKATFKGEPQQLGPTYYHPDSRVETIDEVRANKNATPILVRNMQANGWKLIVWSRWGNWPQPFDPDKDVVIA